MDDKVYIVFADYDNEGYKFFVNDESDEFEPDNFFTRNIEEATSFDFVEDALDFIQNFDIWSDIFSDPNDVCYSIVDSSLVKYLKQPF